MHNEYNYILLDTLLDSLSSSSYTVCVAYPLNFVVLLKSY
jgi:hypothetical protein